MKKKIVFYLTALITVSMLAFYTGCKKDDDDEVPTTTGTCSDGVQNQGESGIDCGGPCASCNVLCNGSTSSLWWPLDSARSWSYSTLTGGSPEEYRVCIGKVMIGTDMYYHVSRTDSVQTGAPQYYYHYASNGDLMVRYSTSGSEALFIPANPTLNQTWSFLSGTMTVVSLTASVTTVHCTYNNLLKMDVTNSTGVVTESYYFKKGLGLINWWHYADMKLVGVDLD